MQKESVGEIKMEKNERKKKCVCVCVCMCVCVYRDSRAPELPELYCRGSSTDRADHAVVPLPSNNIMRALQIGALQKKKSSLKKKASMR